MAKDAYAHAGKTWRCTGCGSPRPGTNEINATIEEDEPDDTPLNLVFGCGLGIARKDFLFALEKDEAGQNLFVGRLLGKMELYLKVG